MGASAWVSRVPYQEDIAAALQVARWDAYSGDDCYRQSELPEARAMTEAEYIAWYGAKYGAEHVSDLVNIEWQAAQIDPVDPDSLLAAQPFAGTHSVIDMIRVGEQPDYNVVAPVPDGVLETVFSTRAPSVADVEAAAQDSRLDCFGRWHGTYVVGYDNGMPHTIFFIGHSGD
jgi:hypothetical protein